ncbi:hypothetical protein THOM_2577 [Trachipleistophora hominis]|uniref:Uncharacterized protein n=1 Tax=Trachipleistophora hominis TaxID=72359 RepID=L7JUN6_TRAHO|nr:hypothetical protein THOM_2577 [Trachipleistophora hominis]
MISTKSIKMYCLEEKRIIYKKKIPVKGSNAKNNRLIVATNDSLLLFTVTPTELLEQRTLNYQTALNIFGRIYGFENKPTKIDKKSLLLRNMHMPVFKIKNEHVNSILPKKSTSKLKVSNKFFIFNNNIKVIRRRSITVTYKGGKLSIYKHNKKVKSFFDNVRQIILLKNLIVFTTKECINLYDFKVWKKVSLRNASIFQIRSGILVFTRNKIYLFDQIRNSNKFLLGICERACVVYRNENVHDIIHLLEFTKNYKELLEISSHYRFRSHSFVESYLKLLIHGSELDSTIIIPMNNLFKTYKFTLFYETALLAQQHNRILFAQYLIAREQNIYKKVHFLIKYKDNNFLSKLITEETNHIFLHHLFSSMRLYLSKNDILSAIRNEDSYLKYKNYIKHFESEYLEFLEDCSRYDELFYFKLERNMIDPRIPLKKAFNARIINILSKFYSLKNYISKHYNYDVGTVDQAITFLLSNNDKKNAFSLKYLSVMCKEKFDYLRNTIT